MASPPLDKIKSADELPADFGKIDGEDHPDTTIARAATKAERQRCVAIINLAREGLIDTDLRAIRSRIEGR